MIKDDLLKQIHRLYRQDAWINALFTSVGITEDNLESTVEDTLNQLFIDTATWGLSTVERDLGISAGEGATYQQRRDNIVARYRTKATLNLDSLQRICDSYNNGQITASFVNGSIQIAFSSEIGMPSDLVSFKNAIETASPAHLAVVYVILRNTYADLSRFTHGQLSSYTHNELRDSDDLRED